MNFGSNLEQYLKRLFHELLNDFKQKFLEKNQGGACCERKSLNKFSLVFEAFLSEILKISKKEAEDLGGIFRKIFTKAYQRNT